VHTELNIAVIGTGYVGLVSGSCFASWGNKVSCVDKDTRKIDGLNCGLLPIYEPGLEALVKQNQAGGRLTFTTDLVAAVQDADIVFITVGTPTRAEQGDADLSFVYAAARDIAPLLKFGAVVVTKSTVPVGTGDVVARIIASARPPGTFAVASNPEFLREGSAIDDFFSPDRVVIGAESELGRRALLALYEPMASANVPILVTKRRTAELIKYASNAFLATKIMFINELADLCEKVGTDIEELATGVGLDKRIGSAFLKAGPGYGGSCFPKDTLALLRTAQDHGVALRIVEETVAANAARKRRMGLKVLEALGGEGNGKTVAVLGLTFKAGTDDMREAPSIQLIETLQRFGIHIRAYDPVGIPNAAGMLRDVVFCEDPYACVQDADATVIVTDWESISELSLERMRHLMRSPILVDLRNTFLQSDAVAAGFQVTSIGHSIPAPAEPERHSVVTLVQPVHRSRSDDVRQAGTAGR